MGLTRCAALGLWLLLPLGAGAEALPTQAGGVAGDNSARRAPGQGEQAHVDAAAEAPRERRLEPQAARQAGHVIDHAVEHGIERKVERDVGHRAMREAIRAAGPDADAGDQRRWLDAGR